MKSRHKPATVDQANQGSQGLPLPAEAVQLAAAAVTLNGTQDGASVAPAAKASLVPNPLGRAAKLLQKDDDEPSDDRVAEQGAPAEAVVTDAIVVAQAPAMAEPAAAESDDRGAYAVKSADGASKGFEFSPILLGLGGLALAAGAGGGGGGVASVVTEVARDVKLLGSFVAGPVVPGHGLVATAYAPGGERLGTAVLKEDGTFQLVLDDKNYVGAVLVEVTDTTEDNPDTPAIEGADYWDEATGAPKDLTVQTLRAVTYVSGGGTVNVNVNVFTEVAVRELEDAVGNLFVENADLPSGVAAHIAAANKKVTDALGLIEDLVTGSAPVAVVTRTGAENREANPYGKLLAAASGIDEAGDTDATIEQLRATVNADNPVLATSIQLLAGASNVVDKVPGFLVQAQMSLNDYFFIADAIDALRNELAGALEVGDWRTVKALSDQLNLVAGALQSLSDGTSVEIAEILGEIGVPAGEGQEATGLYAAIEAAVAAAVTQLGEDIAGLQSQITANDGDIAKLISDAVGQPGDEGYVAPTTNSIAGLQAALASLEAANSGEGGILDTLVSLQAQIAAIVARLDARPLVWNADGAFDGDNPTNAFSVEDVFGVGASGATVLNSFATGFAERIAGFDPATVPLTVTGSLTVAQAVALAQAGLPVNTENVTYSIRDAYTTIQSSLTSPAANAAMAGATEVVAYGNSNPNMIDMMAFGPSINLRIESGAGADTVATGSGDQTVYAARGADTVWLTPSEDDVSSDTVVYQTIFEGKTLPIVTVSFSGDALDYRVGSDLRVTINGVEYHYTVGKGESVEQAFANFAAQLGNSGAPLASAVAQVERTGVDGPVEVSLTLYGATPSTRLSVVAGGDIEAAIVNPGQKTLWTVEFPDFAGAYPDNQSLGGTFTFDRQVHVTIDGTTVSASVVYVDGVADPVATVAALKAAVEAAMGAGVDGIVGTQDDVAGAALAKVLGSVAVAANGEGSNVVLVLEGKTAPATDISAPTFSVSEATIDVPGEQQQTRINFSGDNTDYYAGGQLSVSIAGQTISADMVAGDAAASLENLRQAIDLALHGDVVPSGPAVLTLSGTLNGTSFNGGGDITAIDLGGEVYSGGPLKTISLTVVENGVTLFTTTVAGQTFTRDDANGETSAALRERFVAFLNEEFGGYAVASIVNNNLTLTSRSDLLGSDVSLSFSGNIRTIRSGSVQYASDSSNAGPFSAEGVDTIVPPNAEVAAALETAVVDQVVVNPVSQGVSFVSWEAAGGVTTVRDLNETTFAANLASYGRFYVPLVEVNGYAIAHPSFDTSAYQSFATIATVGDTYASMAEWTAAASATFSALTGQAITVSYNPDNGNISFAGFGTAYRFSGGTFVFGEFQSRLTLTAREEAEDPLQATGQLDYAGEAQTATIELSDAATYTAYANGESTSRGATVYYQGGKVYATIAPVDDPATLEVDESVTNAVTVSADVESARAAGYWAVSSSIGAVSGYTLASVDSVAPGVFYLPLRYTEDGVTTSYPTTSWGGAGKTLGQIAADIAALDFVADAYYEQNPAGGLSLIVEYEPVAGRTYLSGQLVVDVGGTTQANGSLSVRDVSLNDEMTAANLAAAINAQTVEGGELAGLIGSAVYDSATGTITLTAAQPGKETFQVSDVRLDYQGVKQLATVTLDAASRYDEYSFTDEGTPVAIRTDGQPSVYFAGGKAYLTIIPAGADAQPITVSADMVPADAQGGTAAELTTQALVDAINAQAGIEGDLYGVIASASRSGTTITLESAVAGESLFTVSDITLDYQGVNQIATAAFDTTDAPYFAGGDLRIGITPVGGQEIVVSAGMVANDAAGSIAALVAAIQKQIDSPAADSLLAIAEGEESDSRLVASWSEGLQSGGITLSFYVMVGGQRTDVSATAKFDAEGAPSIDLTVNGEPTNIALNTAAPYAVTLGEFLAAVGQAKLPASEQLVSHYATFAVVNNGIEMSSPVADYAGQAVEIGFQFSTVVPTGLSLLSPGADGYYKAADTIGGGLTGIVAGVVVDENGVITLTSANKTQQQFAVSTAEIDYPGVKQSVSVAFDEQLSSYYDTPDYGTDGTLSQIGLTLNGRTFTQSMFTEPLLDGEVVLATAAERTVAALEQQIEDARAEVEDGGSTPTAFANWLNANIESIDRTGTSITFTAKTPDDADLIQLGESFMTVAPLTQVTALDFTGVDFDTRLDAQGQAAQVEVSIAGTTITADAGANNAATVRNLVEQIVIARDGVGEATQVGSVPQGSALFLGAGVDGADVLGYDPIAVNLTVGTSPVSFTFDPLAHGDAGRATVADLVAAINAQLNGVEVVALVDGSLVAVEAEVVGSLAFQTLDFTAATPVAAVSGNLGAIAWDGSSGIVLTAARPGADPLNVSAQYEAEAVDGGVGTKHIVNLSFDDAVFDDPAQTPLGTLVTVEIGGITASVQITTELLAGVPPALRSEAIISALKDSISLAVTYADGTAPIGQVQQGYLDRGTFSAVASAGLQDGDNVLQVTANRNGAHLLGETIDGTLKVSVVKPGNLVVPLAATVGVVQPGAVDYDWNDGASLVDGLAQGRDEGRVSDSPDDVIGATFTVNGAEETSNTAGVPSLVASQSVGEDPTPISQTVTNAGFGVNDNSGFLGDAAQSGDNGAGGYDGDGITQSYTNPGNGYSATSGSPLEGLVSDTAGDATFHGDAALTGGLDEGGSFTGSGVRQTFTNPDNGYTALATSPAAGSANAEGDTVLYGSDPGYYADNGLYTTYLDGGTLVQGASTDAQGNQLYGASGSSADLSTLIDQNDAVNVGQADSTVAVGEGAIVNDQAGFASFTWDEAIATLVTLGNGGPDVIHNFQVDQDVIALEGVLLASTLNGGVDAQGVQAPTVQLVSTVAEQLTVDNVSVSRSTATVFDFTGIDGSFSMGQTTGHSPFTLFAYNPGTGWQFYDFANGDTYDSPLQMAQSVIADAGYANNPTVSFENGILTIAGVGEGVFATDYQGHLTVSSQLVNLPDFDLSTTEFGLVSSVDGLLNVADIGDATQVAHLLNGLFEFTATDNGVLNSTIFAVTAQDDPSVTAIWAHQQSSAGDSTVDAIELFQLATVNTLPGQALDEFNLQNFHVAVMPPV